jgi:hypothetical protein
VRDVVSVSGKVVLRVSINVWVWPSLIYVKALYGKALFSQLLLLFFDGYLW